MVICPELEVVEEPAIERDPFSALLLASLFPPGLLLFTLIVEEGLDVAVYWLSSADFVEIDLTGGGVELMHSCSSDSSFIAKSVVAGGAIEFDVSIPLICLSYGKT